MTGTLTPPQERTRRDDRAGLGGAWRVIVLNDDHNTFEGVAFALAPGRNPAVYWAQTFAAPR